MPAAGSLSAASLEFVWVYSVFQFSGFVSGSGTRTRGPVLDPRVCNRRLCLSWGLFSLRFLSSFCLCVLGSFSSIFRSVFGVFVVFLCFLGLPNPMVFSRHFSSFQFRPVNLHSFRFSSSSRFSVRTPSGRVLPRPSLDSLLVVTPSGRSSLSAVPPPSGRPSLWPALAPRHVAMLLILLHTPGSLTLYMDLWSSVGFRICPINRHRNYKSMVRRSLVTLQNQSAKVDYADFVMKR